MYLKTPQLSGFLRFDGALKKAPSSSAVCLVPLGGRQVEHVWPGFSRCPLTCPTAAGHSTTVRLTAVHGAVSGWGAAGRVGFIGPASGSH